MKKQPFALLLACAAPLAAADYPDQPIRMIVPFSAGGGTDVMGRMLAQKLSDAWKVPVTVARTNRSWLLCFGHGLHSGRVRSVIWQGPDCGRTQNKNHRRLA